MRLIQVGVGGFGAGWLRVVEQDERATLAALVDIDQRALAAAAESTGVAAERCFTDYWQAFRTVEADAVLCVTPPGMHCPVALAAFESGLHVLTEKPLSDTMKDARSMVDAAERAGCTLMVSQNYRFRPWVRTMQSLMRSGKFGAPDNVYVHFAKSPRFEGSFRLKMEHPLVKDMSIHHFDLMRALTGREPVSVFARTWKPEWSWFEHDPCAAALYEFEDGLTVIYNGSWVARGRETTWDGQWSIECANAFLELRGEHVHCTLAEHAHQDAEVEMREMPCTNQAYSLLEFRQAMDQGREPETSGRDNLNSLVMVFAATQSARSGCRVYIQDVLRDGGAA